jgi:hypothetical protein
MQFLPKLHTSIQNMCMYSKNKFYIFLKYRNIIFDFFQKPRALVLGCTKSALKETLLHSCYSSALEILIKPALIKPHYYSSVHDLISM